MPQNERQRVWKGELSKTSGGLTKKDLIKNKRGKIVSKKKSEAARKNKENNLGEWLRNKKDGFLSKGVTAEHVVRKNKRKKKLEKLTLPSSGTVPKKKLDSKKTVVVLPKPKPKAKVAPPKPKPKPKAAPPKPKPKVAPPKPKPKPKAAPPKPKPKPKKKKGPPVIEQQAPEKVGEVKDLSKVSIGNILKEEEHTWVETATQWKNEMGATEEDVIDVLGPPPPGVTWDTL